MTISQFVGDENTRVPSDKGEGANNKGVLRAYRARKRAEADARQRFADERWDEEQVARLQDPHGRGQFGSAAREVKRLTSRIRDAERALDNNG